MATSVKSSVVSNLSADGAATAVHLAVLTALVFDAFLSLSPVEISNQIELKETSVRAR